MNDGWIIVREQYPIRIERKRVWIDLFVQKPEANAFALIEVKELENESIEDLRNAIGQYMLYKAALKYAGLTRIPLYLAVSVHAMEGIFSTRIGRIMLDQAKVNLLIYDPKQEVIKAWNPYKKL